MGGMPDASDQSTALGKRAEAMVRKAETAEQETPTGSGSGEAAAAGTVGGKKRPLDTLEPHQTDEHTDVGMRAGDLPTGVPAPVPDPVKCP